MTSNHFDNGNFVKIASCQVAGVLASKYKSSRTGLVVCLAQVEGPLVNGYVCLATEAHDHDGLPHTLEHLVFMGSEEYPYKGVLDLFANRCLAQGTNAWTDVDHTCYTVMTAGSDGFLNLLPIYLDHILYPTLTDAAYMTEVHHINKKGEDAGVVYCEMQARENTCEDITHFHLAQHMYPGHCGYKSETGGRLENLRTSCCNEKVCKYHASYYRPDNLCLIVTGQVDPDRLFEALRPFEDKILSKGDLPPMERPWQSAVPELPQSVREVVKFPTDEEDEGIARISWRGPSAQNRYAVTAMGCLGEYLSETSVSPLQRDLVEIEEPFCCEIDTLVLENMETAFGFTFEGVPTAQLEGLPTKVQEVLEGLASGQEELDMKRMTAIVNNHILHILNNVESSPHFFFAVALIGDFLFSQSADQFDLFVDELPRYKRILTESSSFWVGLIKKYFVDGPSVVILGSPCSKLASKMTKEEKARIDSQANKLGAEGLKKKEEELKEAMSKNEVAPPTDLVCQLPIPKTDSIYFHPVVTLSNQVLQEKISKLPEYPKFPVHTLPCFCQVNHIHSAFVEMQVVLDTRLLPPDLLLYIPLYLEMLFESPVVRDGKVIPYEEVVKELDADSVDIAAGLGMGGGRFTTGVVPQAVFIQIKVEADKYGVGVAHLKEVLFSIQFTKERIQVVASKMINDVSSFKRRGGHVAKTMLKQQVYQDSCCPNVTSMLSQAVFLNKVVTKLKDSSSHEVLAALETVRSTLSSPDNFRLFLAMDVDYFKDTNLVEAWQTFLPQGSSIAPSMLPLVHPLRDIARPSPVRAQIAGVAGVESNFLAQMTPCVTSHSHPDLPAIMVFMEYLCALEGPMWRQIRGMGLSYNYRMNCWPDEGQLYFQLAKSSQLVQAYKVAKEIMDGYLSGRCGFDQSSLEAAISGVLFEVIEREKTMSDVADQVVINHFRQLEPTYTRDFLASVAKVTADDLKRVGGLYFSKLFSPSESVTAVCCSPGKVAEVKQGLEELGMPTMVVVEDLNSLASELQPS